MVAACRAAGVVMGTNHHLRNAGTHRAMRERDRGRGASAGRCSPACSMPSICRRTCRAGASRRPSAGGGVVLDITVHDADTLRFVLGDEPVEVVAMHAEAGMAAAGIEDGVMGVIRFRIRPARAVPRRLHDELRRHRLRGARHRGLAVRHATCMTQRPIGRGRCCAPPPARRRCRSTATNLYERALARLPCRHRAARATPAATGEDGVRSLATALGRAANAAQRAAGAVADRPGL